MYRLNSIFLDFIFSNPDILNIRFLFEILIIGNGSISYISYYPYNKIIYRYKRYPLLRGFVYYYIA